MRGLRWTMAVLGLWLLAPLAPGGAMAPSAWAQASVQAAVTVARGVKGGDAAKVDDKLAAHARTLSRVGGFGDWKAAGGAKLDVAVGKTESSAVGDHKLQITLESVSADKAKTTVTVVDGAGKSHRVSASLARGGSQVLAVEAADGSSVLLYIVTIRY